MKTLLLIISTSTVLATPPTVSMQTFDSLNQCYAVRDKVSDTLSAQRQSRKNIIDLRCVPLNYSIGCEDGE